MFMHGLQDLFVSLFDLKEKEISHAANLQLACCRFGVMGPWSSVITVLLMCIERY